MRFTLVLVLVISCARPTPSLTVPSLGGSDCTFDADCELVSRCCSCCGPVAMNHTDAREMRNRCAVVDCSGDCTKATCGPAATRATCLSGTCVAD